MSLRQTERVNGPNYSLQPNVPCSSTEFMIYLIDLSKFQDFCLFCIDQEKAFDRVDHNYLFKIFEAFHFGETFIFCIRLLHSGAGVLLKGDDSAHLSLCTEASERDVICYSHEPLLHQLRQRLTVLTLTVLSHEISLSAYADDIIILINDPKDIDTLN